MSKILVIDPEKCTGCRLCEQVCSVKHERVVNPYRARIKVVKWEMEGKILPVVCQQCEDAPCAAACPVHAIARNPETGALEVNYDLCIGCRTCVNVCPFGAMGFDWVTERVIKCDLCGGDPQCARFCETGAILYVDKSELSAIKQRKGADSLMDLMTKVSAAVAGTG